jgi:hypothetical protein
MQNKIIVAIEVRNETFEHVEEFVYLETIVSNKHRLNEEMNNITINCVFATIEFRIIFPVCCHVNEDNVHSCNIGMLEYCSMTGTALL